MLKLTKSCQVKYGSQAGDRQRLDGGLQANVRFVSSDQLPILKPNRLTSGLQEHVSFMVDDYNYLRQSLSHIDNQLQLLSGHENAKGPEQMTEVEWQSHGDAEEIMDRGIVLFVIDVVRNPCSTRSNVGDSFLLHGTTQVSEESSMGEITEGLQSRLFAY
jgi:hypothetical protein